MNMINGNKVERIGNTSAFSKVYRAVDNTNIVYILTKDTAKEMLIGLNNPHIPTMVKIAEDTYQTEYSRSIQLTDVNARMIVMNLSNNWNALRSKNENKRKQDRLVRKDLVKVFIDSLQVNKLYSADLISALHELYSAACNTGFNFSLDFPVENFGISNDGTLLLRDVICFIK